MKHKKLVSCIMLIAFAMLPSMTEAQTKNSTSEAIKAAKMALKKAQVKGEQARQDSSLSEVDLSKEIQMLSKSKGKTEIQELEDSTIYDVVDEMPQFPGGPQALYEYLSKNMKYPVAAEKNDIQGRVVAQFVIERDGSIGNVKVTKSVDLLLDKEAIRLLQSMPHWIPGKKDGVAVRVKYTVPVTFRLQ